MAYLYVLIGLFVISLLSAGLFAFLETSFTALRLFKVKELQASITRYKSVFTTWENNPQQILITILIANNFAHVMCSVLITEIMQELFGSGTGLAIGIGLATILILIFGEIIPKSWAKAHHKRLFARTLWVISLLLKLFYPLTKILMFFSNMFFHRVAGGAASQEYEDISEKEIEFLIDYSDEKGLMETGKSEMLQNVFELDTKFVYDIIVPKNDMIAIEVNSTLDSALSFFARYRYSRLPVYEGKEDNIIGIIYQKDIFAVVSKNKTKQLKDFVRPVLFVPETKKINQLLTEFLEKRMHMAIVVDEYGNVSGLVTLEDVIEEIVGDISDEDEKVHTEIVALEKGGWLVDGRVSLDNLEEVLSINFDAADSVTISGFLAEQLQHLPRKGERITYKGFCFQIQQASRRRVLQVLIFKEEEK